MDKGGALPGNVNRVRHGHRSKRFGVVLARLGQRFRGAYVDVLRLRRQVESLLRQRHGELSLLQVGRIQTLSRLEQSARALEMTIRENPKMSSEELRQVRHSICAWSRERDNILRELLGDKLDGNGSASADPWACLDADQGAPGSGADREAECNSGAASGIVEESWERPLPQSRSRPVDPNARTIEGIRRKVTQADAEAATEAAAATNATKGPELPNTTKDQP